MTAFTITKHAAHLWEVSGRFTLRGKIGAGEASQMCRTKAEATKLAHKWERTEQAAQYDVILERERRYNIAAAYLAARAARPANSQLSFDF